MRKGATMDDEVSVKLTVEEIAERGETIARKLIHIGAMRKQAKEAAATSKALIDSELDEVERLARVIGEQEELRRQGDLRFDQVPSPAEAQEALAKVAAGACTCPEGDVHAIDCPVHAPVDQAVGGEAEGAAV